MPFRQHSVTIAIALGSCVAAACGDSAQVQDAAKPDARVADARLADARVDAAPDAAPDAPCDTVLLAPGTLPETQGWTAVTAMPFATTVRPTEVELSTSNGATTSGLLLLTYPTGFTATTPFDLSVELAVDRVDAHNLLDAGAAILLSFTPQFGSGPQRSQMLYLDGAAIGWGDETNQAAFNNVDGNFHDYRFSYDGAGKLEVRVDGSLLLTRMNPEIGTLAIGDQTNDPNVNSTIRVKRVVKHCLR